MNILDRKDINMNHIVLIGEVKEFKEDSIILCVDEKLNLPIMMTPYFMDILKESELDTLYLGIKGSLDLDKDNNIVVFADKMSLIAKEKENEKGTENKDMVR